MKRDYGRRRGKLGVRSCYHLFMSFTAQTRHAGDIILFEGRIAIYKHSTDLMFYIIGSSEENELMLSLALNSFHDALSVLLRNQIERRAVLENYDLTMLCLDETIDDG